MLFMRRRETSLTGESRSHSVPHWTWDMLAPALHDIFFWAVILLIGGSLSRTTEGWNGSGKRLWKTSLPDEGQVVPTTSFVALC
jgi:hypothetical protein